MTMQNILDQALRDPKITSAILGVETSKHSWHGAAGTLSLQNTEKAKGGDAFVIHSITKPFTSAATLLAVEDGLLTLDQPICQLLPPSTVNKLHVLEGTDYSSQITVRQLLGHRTGLPDYFFDGVEDQQNQTPFQKIIFSETDTLWEPADVVLWTKKNLTPLFSPGKSFHYSDTNYMLVGLALEELHGKPLRQIFKDEIYKPLGLKNTWMNFREKPLLNPNRSLTHVYTDQMDLTCKTSMSSDWAGGGLVSTTHDLYLFLKGMITGELFTNPSSLEQIRTSYQSEEDGGHYGLGLFRYTVNDIILEGHTGYGGSFLFYEANFNFFIMGTVNQSNADFDITTPAIENTVFNILQNC